MDEAAVKAIGERAIEYGLARLERNRLRTERADLKCEEGDQYDPQCWRADDIGDKPDEWCEPCKKNQVVHKKYQKAVYKAQGLHRSLLSKIKKLEQR